MNKTSKGMLIAGAAAALFLTGALTARADEKAGGDQVTCSGINSCKGQGTCAGGGNSCAGQNSCKGKGNLKTSMADCKAKGGKVVETPKH
jgi:uncharacterized membrane protein